MQQKTTDEENQSVKHDSDTAVLQSYLNNQRLSGGAPADDGLGDVVALGPSLVVQRGSGNGGRFGELNDPVAIEVVFATQVFDGCPCTEVTVIARRGESFGFVHSPDIGSPR